MARALAFNLVRIIRRTPQSNLQEREASLVSREAIPRRGIPAMKFRSKRPYIIPLNKTSLRSRPKIIEARKATGFGSEQLAMIANESYIS